MNYENYRVLFIIVGLERIGMGGGALQETVRDSRGDPIKGTEIRIEGKNGNLAIKSRRHKALFF